MDYVMGRTVSETDRLMLQAEIYRPHSEHLFTMAGIAPGMRVLDVGCGPGDVSLLMAELVGPTGSVVGIDSDPAVLDVARERTRHLSNVEFRQAVLPDIELDGPVDALVGRLILMHLPDPADAVRTLSRHVRPGGVVTFQDFDIEAVRSVPPTPLMTSSIEWIVGSVRAGGAHHNPGAGLYGIFRQAGLDVAGVAGSQPAGDGESPNIAHAAATVTSLVPLIEKAGLATAADIDADTLLDRLRAEALAADAVLFSPELVAAWSRV